MHAPAEYIGRTILNVPNEKAVSFVHKKGDDNWFFKKYRKKEEQLDDLGKCLPDIEDCTRTPDGILLCGKNEFLCYFDPKNGQGKAIAANLKDLGIGAFYRLAMSPDRKKWA